MLRLLLAFIISCTFALQSKAQQNLVPNPSFEDVLKCPDGNNNITDCESWMNMGTLNTTPDFFHTCATLPQITPPTLQFGYQYPRSGNGMAGIITYIWQHSPGWPDYREIIGTQLTSPLVVGQKYFVSFYVNNAGYQPGWQHIGSNKTGMRFSTVPRSEQDPPLLDNFAHLYTDSILVDTLGWYKISGSFIADFAYPYLLLGNFFDENNTDTIIFGGAPFGGSSAYYYVDDVCVTTDSLYNEGWTNIPDYQSQSTSIVCYPNPVSDILSVNSTIPITSIELTNYLGQTVLKQQGLNAKNLELVVKHIPPGQYIFKAGHLNQTHYRKIFIH
jgi:hypothetical protein